MIAISDTKEDPKAKAVAEAYRSLIKWDPQIYSFKSTDVFTVIFYSIN